MKRFLWLILSISIIFTIFPQNYVNAQTNLEKNLEEITIKVKDLFDINYEYQNFNSSVDTYGDTIRYYLNWQDDSKDIPDINVLTDKDGNIISFDKNYKREAKDKLTNIDKNQSKDIALGFVKGIAPEKIDEISELKGSRNINSPWNDFYTIEFYRHIKQVPYYGNRVQVNIDKNRKEVITYNADWDYELEFPNKEKVIEIEKAKKILKEKIGLQLIYKTKYNMENNERNFYLAYDFLEENKVVDAISGEVTNIDYYRNSYGGVGGSEDIADKESLNINEREEIKKLSGIKTVDEIEKSARESLEIENEYDLIESGLSTSWKNEDEYIWHLYFEKDIEKPQGISISLNAKTKEILSFYISQDFTNKKPIIKSEEALEIAKDYIKKINPEKYKHMEYMAQGYTNDQETYNFSFIRKYEDAYVEDDNINIGINSNNKAVFSYSQNWYNEKIPAKIASINKEKAYDILFDEIGYELMYIKTYDEENLKNPRDNRENTKIKLVYNTPQNMPLNIDAKTGKLLDESGKEYIDKKRIEYTDIENSYAKDKIRTLAEYGISFEEDKFRPKDEIIQKDFVNLLWQAINPYSVKSNNTDKMYKDLINMGIIKEDEKAPNQKLTKENAVALIIRAMNYEEIANLEDIYKEDIFIDWESIDPKYIGHINLAYGLHIIEGNGDTPEKINPKKKLTREDAGNIIYNYIFR
jgi:uncharacterized protein DUF4901/S-layer family protein